MRSLSPERGSQACQARPRALATSGLARTDRSSSRFTAQPGGSTRSKSRGIWLNGWIFKKCKTQVRGFPSASPAQAGVRPIGAFIGRFPNDMPTVGDQDRGQPQRCADSRWHRVAGPASARRNSGVGIQPNKLRAPPAGHPAGIEPPLRGWSAGAAGQPDCQPEIEMRRPGWGQLSFLRGQRQGREQRADASGRCARAFPN